VLNEAFFKKFRNIYSNEVYTKLRINGELDTLPEGFEALKLIEAMCFAQDFELILKKCL
jgi:hypothetical protein